MGVLGSRHFDAVLLRLKGITCTFSFFTSCTVEAYEAKQLLTSLYVASCIYSCPKSNLSLSFLYCRSISDFVITCQFKSWCDSPEVVTRSSHGLECDVWSLGCMLFIMLVGHPPFDGKGLKEAIFTKIAMEEHKVSKSATVLHVNLICTLPVVPSYLSTFTN